MLFYIILHLPDFTILLHIMGKLLLASIIIWLICATGYIIGLSIYAVPTLMNYKHVPCTIIKCEPRICNVRRCTGGKVKRCKIVRENCPIATVELNNDSSDLWRISSSSCNINTEKTCYYKKNNIRESLSFDKDNIIAGPICIIVICGVVFIAVTIWMICMCCGLSHNVI